MKTTKIQDISKHPEKPLANAPEFDLMPLPGVENSAKAAIPALTEEQCAACESSLDGVSALALPKPKTKEEEEKLVASFLSGLEKLLTPENNWTFLQPLKLSLDYCGKCLACAEACPIYVGSGRQDIYRPTYRSEVLRRIIKKYLHGGNNFLTKFQEGDIDLNWATVARLGELAYRCTICRRCTQTCNRGVDNGLIAREIRKVFSQEMGIAPKEIHDLGSIKQLKTGASTGVSPKAFKNMVQFAEDDIEERTGKKIKIPVDKEGADILLIHNSGEFITWPENPEAFAIIFEAAGLNWTLSSDLYGYEGTNYGTWYDDVQFARIALRQFDVARKMKVKKIVVGECGHAHKAMVVVADRLLTGPDRLPRESFLPVLENIVLSGKLDLDPQRNNFPVTLQDPCNMVRLMGIVEPQRRILSKIAPQFREMNPHGVDNYCCGGGSGFGIIGATNFGDWRTNVAGRMKVKQIMDVFADAGGPEVKKYICAPCSNCKGQIRNLIDAFDLRNKYGINYGGLVELVVNSMKDIKQPFIRWE